MSEIIIKKEDTTEYTVYEFIEYLKKLNEEDIGCDGKRAGSHDLMSSVTIQVNNEYYSNIYVSINRLSGCGCGSGITLFVADKFEDEDN